MGVIGGVGVPAADLMIIISLILPAAIIFVIAYFVIRNAVAAGILRAEKLRKEHDDTPSA